ncbi:MAG: hypothetical protein H0W63_07050 [Gemmatimonadaceae bacterium]|nr:hypothetical protein [Gemmatimonadaceae bacterium]
MNDLVAKVRAFVIANRYYLVVGAVTLVAVLASLWVAKPARKEREALSAEEAKLEALIKSSNLWVTQFQPASTEESAIWQTTASEISALGVKPAERLTLGQIVLRRAEDAGYAGAHIKFIPAGAAANSPPRQAGGVSFNPASYALQVTGTGSLAMLSSFVGAIPPAVALQSISLTGAGDAGASTAVTLSVFEPAGSNGK